MQKIIASSGLASRREAEEWIRQGRVRVNGKLASLGDRADPVADSIKVDDRRVRAASGPRTYLLLNKPKGYVTTVSDPEGRDTVLQLLPGRLRRTVKPVGRLDVQTEGLLLLTDDGDLARLVTHPSTGCPKEYLVKVSGEPTPAQLEKLRRGVFLDGERTRPCDIDRVSGTPRREGQEGNTWLRVTLREGRSRQLRRMFAAVGHPVSKLRRVAIGPVRDETLSPGASRLLSAAEVAALKRLGKPQ
ncbi:MAG TPA: pseudouridine synthase [Thermoanaerobaculia bacterium]|nr:pseudouridine synthase [Thermoanaerobaculia bacterium]